MPPIGRSARGGVGEVLGVSGLVEERGPVVVASDRLNDEHHLAGHLDRRAEGTRALAGPLLDVEVDVVLRPQVDPEIAERCLERGKHPLGRVGLVELGCAEEARHVGRPGVGETDSEAPAEETVSRLLPRGLGLFEQVRALRGQLVEAKPKRR